MDAAENGTMRMTIRQLSQLYYLNGEIRDCERKLQELEAQVGITAIPIDDMPHGSGKAGSQVERIAAEIVDLKAIINAKRIECIHERQRIERYIAEIPDSITRQIFWHRFAECKTWEQVADSLGGNNTGESVKKRCYRYLKVCP